MARSRRLKTWSLGLSNKFPVLQVDFVPRLDTSDDSAAFVSACALGDRRNSKCDRRSRDSLEHCFRIYENTAAMIHSSSVWHRHLGPRGDVHLSFDCSGGLEGVFVYLGPARLFFAGLIPSSSSRLDTLAQNPATLPEAIGTPCRGRPHHVGHTVGRPLKTWSLGLSNKFPARGVPGEGPDCHVPKVIVRFKPTPTAFRRKGGQISAGYTDLCSIVREKHRADRRRK